MTDDPNHKTPETLKAEIEELSLQINSRKAELAGTAKVLQDTLQVTGGEIAGLNKAIVDGKAELAELETKVKVFKDRVANADPSIGVWQHRHGEAGQWARHFSAVRMTVSPFLFTTSLAVLAFKWDKGEWVFVIASALTWFAAIWLLIVFTYLTYTQIWRQRDYSNKVPPDLPDADKTRIAGSGNKWPWEWWRAGWLLDQGLLIGIVLTLGYGGAVCYWCYQKITITKEIPTALTVALTVPATMPKIEIQPTTLPAIQVETPSDFPHVKFDIPVLMPSVRFETPATLPSIKFENPPRFSKVEFNTPTTLPSVHVVPPIIMDTSPTTGPALSINDNRLEINVPAAEPKKFHILKLGILGIDLCDISIPSSKAEPPSKPKSGGK